MRTFIANSACCGRWPKGTGRLRLCERPRLLKKMMASRNVARFIVAPQGFGKTSLAYGYADSIFGFENVFWVNGQSPCFLRDLDDGIVALSLLEESPSGALAIFEDVPYLDDVRSDSFSRDIDDLLSHDWEVVVTTTPGADSLAERQNDRTLIGARDLLVDDEEAYESEGSLKAGEPCHRAPALVWGGEGGALALLKDACHADAPAEVQFAVFVMAVLGEGSMEDLLSFVRGLRKDTRRFIEEHYPYTGLDLVEERFATHGFSVSEISSAFHGSIDSILRKASSSGRDAVLFRLASLLVSKGRHGRACDLMAAMCPRGKRAVWIEAEQSGFLAAGRVDVLQKLFESLGEHPAGLTPSLLCGSAIRLFLLGDESRALRFSLRAIGHADCTEESACIAALTACAISRGEQGSRARAVLRNARERSLGSGGALSIAAAACLCDGRDIEEALSSMEQADEIAWCEPAFVCALARIVETIRELHADEKYPRNMLDRAHSLAVRVLRMRRAADFPPDLFEAVLCDSVGQRAWASCCARRKREVDAIALSLADQRRTWADARSVERYTKSHRFERDGRTCEEVPPMDVRLFGGMEIRIDGRIIEQDVFIKKKAKTLLAVLVLHRGKEVARQELLDILWPESSADRAVNNFYSLWSALRRALEDEKGVCPYVARRQAGCMVDARYVRSDVDEFEKLCRMLFFGQPDVDAWMDVYTRLQDDFSCSLLPSETGNAYIARLRERYRTRLIDAYVTAAERLCDAGEPQAALWFANAAVEGPSEREDAYCALMRAQMLVGRRDLAMETFSACRRFMREELGMDPSERMARLHRDLISSDGHDGYPVSSSAKRERGIDMVK